MIQALTPLIGGPNLRQIFSYKHVSLTEVAHHDLDPQPLAFII